MNSQSADSTPAGLSQPTSTYGEFNNIAFAIQQAMGKMQTATIVQVVSCTNSGSVSPVGFVDVLPMVNQIDSQGNAVPHTTIHNIPYMRLQGGANAVIIDPQPGDLGICIFASRDLSKVKATKKQANPGSYRRYNFADGMYLGGLLNGAPIQYIEFDSSGIKIHSPTKVTLEGPIVEIDAGTSCTVNTPLFTVNGATVLNGTLSQGLGTGGGSCSLLGPLTVTNDVVGQGTSLHTHHHSGVTTGSGNTGPPT